MPKFVFYFENFHKMMPVSNIHIYIYKRLNFWLLNKLTPVLERDMT